MGEHAKLSPSSAKRWLTCTASAEAAARSVTPDTEHSRFGTAGHWVRSEWMENGEPPRVKTQTPNGLLVTEEMIELVRPGIEWTRDYVKSAGGPCAVFVEERVVIAPYFGLPAEECFGTADQIILAPSELLIYDLKLGFVDVVAEANEQLSLYALGTLEQTGWLHDKLRFVIDQPRQGGIKEWEITAVDLKKWADERHSAVVEAATGPGRYVATEDGCRYCPVAGVCTELQRHSLELARMEFLPDPQAIVKNITVEDLSLLLEKGELVETAMKAAREHALKLIQSGIEVPGYKAVEGRRNRIWKNEAEAVKVLKDKSISPYKPPELISPAQAEKLVKGIDHLIEKPRGNPVLAAAGDKRPALAAHFDIIPDVGNLLD